MNARLRSVVAVLIVTLVSVVLAACTSEPSPAPTPAPTAAATPVAATPTPTPVPTATPTPTPVPTATPTPTPVPTATPTPTPVPTATPTPTPVPTATPTPTPVPTATPTPTPAPTATPTPTPAPTATPTPTPAPTATPTPTPAPTATPTPAPTVSRPDDLLPFDPAVVRGTLSNGLSYYIRHNEEPRNRAQLSLVVKAGSILEEEEQRGLAHFVEHMAFNGTERFAKQQIVDYLESIGSTFGADLNAQTGYDSTMYFLEIPADDPEILETAFQILSDWAYAITLSPDEVELERGVILEEWRLFQGFSSRFQTKPLPAALGLLPLRRAEPDWPHRCHRDRARGAVAGVLRALVQA